MNKILVGWLYPDVLNLHGERANAAAFDLISKKMDVSLKIDRIDDINSTIDFNKYDILLINPGELKQVINIVNKLESQKEELLKYINDNKILFVTGTSGAIFSKSITRIDGSIYKGLDILDMDVIERSEVIGDDLHFMFDDMEIMASQIQMIDVKLNNVEAFGNVIYGYGNDASKKEGARYKNLYFTNALGPVLVKNPWLCEYLIKLALKNKNINYEEKSIDYELEKNSLESCKEFIERKISIQKDKKY